MPSPRPAAARGLAALIPTSVPTIRHAVPAKAVPAKATKTAAQEPKDAVPQAIPGLELITVGLDDVRPNPRQPRQEFDPEAIDELAQSIIQVGLLQPIVVRESSPPKLRLSNEGDSPAPRYELVAGERRLRAARAAGLTSIPAVVRSTDDNAMLRDALLENLQRVALNPLEEGAAYQQLLADFGGTHDELAEKLGKSRPQVSNTLRLLKLPAPVQRRVAAGVLSAGHARALLSITEPGEIERLAVRVIAEGLSVRALEEIVAVGDGSPTKKKRKSALRAAKLLPELEAVADRLADRFETRVQVTMGATKGKIVIEFGGIDDLARLVELLGGPTIPNYPAPPHDGSNEE